jgi:protein-ribulosamine 3-kinase
MGVEGALTEHGLGTRIDRQTPVGGGCINNGARIETDAGAVLFLKWNRSAPREMFEAEADGLSALAGASTLRVPSPVSCGGGEAGTPAWLLMEHIARGPTGAPTLEALGRGLAQMHARVAEGYFGWERDNWIGSLDQLNEPAERWGDFWRDRRIGPQLSLAHRRGLARDATFDDLIDRIPEALSEVEVPELVHGDLWGGNWFADEEGRPVLIDPAVYRGHGEVDLAMSELFGGFGPAFYDAYGEIREIEAAYDAYRKDLYQLYYLLVHVNLFGAAYEAGSLAAARRVLAEVG